jgi:hypothetical protein
MLSVNIKWKLSIHISIILFAITAVLPTISMADQTRIWVKKLHPSTGFNSDCDTPLFSLPAPLPPDMHFDFIGLYNPDAPTQGEMRDAFTLQQSDCENSLEEHVASTSNMAFLATNGILAPDPRLKNLRTNEIPKVAAPDGVRFTLPPEGAVLPPLPPTNSAPNNPLTLKAFRSVRGMMLLKCRANGSARVQVTLRNYQPHELLTIWAVWLAIPPGAAEPAPTPAPFGGVPNAVVTDEHGFARFTRTLSYCPMDVQPNGAQLMFLDVTSHLDGSIYGAVPDTVLVETTFVDPNDPSSTFTSPLSVGIVTVSRGLIPMLVSTPH